MSVPAGRRRNPLLVLGLCMATLGLYALVWFHTINRELNRASLRPWPVASRVRVLALLAAGSTMAGLAGLGLEEDGLLAASGTLAVAAGVVLVLVEFRTCENLERAQRARGVGGGHAVPLFLLLLIVPLVGIPVVQSQTNRVWASRAARGPTK